MISDQGRKEQMERLLCSRKGIQLHLSVGAAWVLLNACQIAEQDDNVQTLTQLGLAQMTHELGREIQRTLEKVEPKSAPFMEAGWDRGVYATDDDDSSRGD